MENWYCLPGKSYKKYNENKHSYLSILEREYYLTECKAVLSLLQRVIR